jgi:hypothetical protein
VNLNQRKGEIAMFGSALLNVPAARAGSIRVDQRAVESTTAPRSRLASRAVLTALHQRGCVPKPTLLSATASLVGMYWRFSSPFFLAYLKHEELRRKCVL